MDKGEYLRVGELHPGDAEANIQQPFTFRETAEGGRAFRRMEKAGLSSATSDGEGAALDSRRQAQLEALKGFDPKPMNGAKAKL